jgi:hypothetical protein
VVPRWLVQVLHPPRKFEQLPFWNDWSYRIKNYDTEVTFNGMTSLSNFIKNPLTVLKVIRGHIQTEWWSHKPKFHFLWQQEKNCVTAPLTDEQLIPKMYPHYLYSFASRVTMPRHAMERIKKIPASPIYQNKMCMKIYKTIILPFSYKTWCFSSRDEHRMRTITQHTLCSLSLVLSQLQ